MMSRLSVAGRMVILGAALAATPSLAQQQDEKVVPVHEEPRHRLVFDSPVARVLDIQIPPGDTTLFHTHSNPILYVNMSSSQTRSQTLGQEWSGGEAAARPAPRPPAARSADTKFPGGAESPRRACRPRSVRADEQRHQLFEAVAHAPRQQHRDWRLPPDRHHQSHRRRPLHRSFRRFRVQARGRQSLVARLSLAAGPDGSEASARESNGDRAGPRPGHREHAARTCRSTRSARSRSSRVVWRTA